MANKKFNREDGTFTQVDFSDLTGSVSSSSVVTSIGGLVGAVSIGSGLSSVGGILSIASTAFFSATKSASQVINDATFTDITWDTEVSDVGSHFASNAWIPPSGVVQVLSSALLGGTYSTGAAIAIRIMKNGSALSQWSNNAVSAGAGNFVSVVALDKASGTDSYGVQIYGDTSAGSVSVNSGANSGFSGVWLGP